MGEYIPFRFILGKVISRLSPLKSHLKAGDNSQIFKTTFGQAIIGICYESAFSEHFRRQAKIGGEFIFDNNLLLLVFILLNSSSGW